MLQKYKGKKKFEVIDQLYFPDKISLNDLDKKAIDS